jgi:hypothetical protein
MAEQRACVLDASRIEDQQHKQAENRADERSSSLRAP